MVGEQGYDAFLVAQGVFNESVKDPLGTDFNKNTGSRIPLVASPRAATSRK